MAKEKNFKIKSSFGVGVLMKIAQKALKVRYPKMKIKIHNDDETIKFTGITKEELILFLEGPPEEKTPEKEIPGEENPETEKGLLDEMKIKLRAN